MTRHVHTQTCWQLRHAARLAALARSTCRQLVGFLLLVLLVGLRWRVVVVVARCHDDRCCSRRPAARLLISAAVWWLLIVEAVSDAQLVY